MHFPSGARRPRRLRGSTAQRAPAPLGSCAAVARLMALALRFEELVRQAWSGLQDLGVLGHVTARVSQILNLIHLAPDIQEALLFRRRPERGRDSLDLRKVLPLTKVWDWQKQRRLWRGLADSGLARSRRGPRLVMRIPPVT